MKKLAYLLMMAAATTLLSCCCLSVTPCSEFPGEVQKVLEWFRDYKASAAGAIQ